MTGISGKPHIDALVANIINDTITGWPKTGSKMGREKDLKWLNATDQLANIFSTCSKKQYSCIILTPNGRVSGFGYNGSPPNHPHCDQGHCPRLTEKNLTRSQPGAIYDNCIANHAEANALLWSDISTRQGGTLIINGPPCFGCCKLIASSGIARIVHYSDPAYTQWPDCYDFLLTSNIEITTYDRQPQ